MPCGQSGNRRLRPSGAIARESLTAISGGPVCKCSLGVIAYRSFRIACVRCYMQLRANAIQRLMQGPGPFLLTFKETVPYMPIQVDGEFYIARNLSSISVRRMGSYGMLKYRDPNEKP